MTRIISLLPAATEIAGALGLMENVVGVSHECDFPAEANLRPRVTRLRTSTTARQAAFTLSLPAGMSSGEVDNWVRSVLRENGAIYTIDETLVRELRPDVILTQKLCDVCAVGYGTVAQLAKTLPGSPIVVNLEPSSLSDIYDDIRRVAKAGSVTERGERVVTELSQRVEAVRERIARIPTRPRCFLMEWVDPPFCSGHWGPELVEIAGGHDPLGRKHQRSIEIKWEAVLEARPEILVLALCGYDVDRARCDYELMKGFPGFDTLPAARNGRIHVVNGSSYFSRPGPRVVDSVELLAGILHPNEFPEFVCDVDQGRAWRVADS